MWASELKPGVDEASGDRYAVSPVATDALAPSPPAETPPAEAPPAEAPRAPEVVSPLTRSFSSFRGWVLAPLESLAPGEAVWATWPRRYCTRMLGMPGKLPPPRPALVDIGYVGLLVFAGMLACLAPHYFFRPGTAPPLLIISAAASAVLIYGAPMSPLAQPRNVFFGHLVSAFIGVSLYKAIVVYSPLPEAPYIVGCFSVAASTSVMLALGILHPPGGATALIAVIGPGVPDAGWMWILNPVLVTAVILVLVALVLNNLFTKHRYPMYW